MHLVAWPYNFEPWAYPPGSSLQVRYCFAPNRFGMQSLCLPRAAGSQARVKIQLNPWNESIRIKQPCLILRHPSLDARIQFTFFQIVKEQPNYRN